MGIRRSSLLWRTLTKCEGVYSIKHLPYHYNFISLASLNTLILRKPSL